MSNACAALFLRTYSESTVSFPTHATLVAKAPYLFGAITAYGLAFISYGMALRTTNVSVAYVLITALTFLILSLYDLGFGNITLTWHHFIGVPAIIIGTLLISRAA